MSSYFFLAQQFKIRFILVISLQFNIYTYRIKYSHYYISYKVLAHQDTIKPLMKRQYSQSKQLSEQQMSQISHQSSQFLPEKKYSNQELMEKLKKITAQRKFMRALKYYYFVNFNNISAYEIYMGKLSKIVARYIIMDFPEKYKQTSEIMNKICINRMKNMFYNVYLQQLKNQPKYFSIIEEVWEGLVKNFYFKNFLVTQQQKKKMNYKFIEINYSIFNFSEIGLQDATRYFLIKLVFEDACQKHIAHKKNLEQQNRFPRQLRSKKKSDKRNQQSKFAVKNYYDQTFSSLLVLSVRQSFIYYNKILLKQVQNIIDVIKNSKYFKQLLLCFLKGRQNKLFVLNVLRDVPAQKLAISQLDVENVMKSIKVYFFDFCSDEYTGITYSCDETLGMPIYINLYSLFNSNIQYSYDQIKSFIMFVFIHEVAHCAIRKIGVIGLMEDSYPDYEDITKSKDQFVDIFVKSTKRNKQKIRRDKELEDGGWLFQKFAFGGRVNVIGANDYKLVQELLTQQQYKFQGIGNQKTCNAFLFTQKDTKNALEKYAQFNRKKQSIKSKTQTINQIVYQEQSSEPQFQIKNMGLVQKTRYMAIIENINKQIQKNLQKNSQLRQNCEYQLQYQESINKFWKMFEKQFEKKHKSQSQRKKRQAVLEQENQKQKQLIKKQHKFVRLRKIFESFGAKSDQQRQKSLKIKNIQYVKKRKSLNKSEARIKCGQHKLKRYSRSKYQ